MKRKRNNAVGAGSFMKDNLVKKCFAGFKMILIRSELTKQVQASNKNKAVEKFFGKWLILANQSIK
jgi:hypothetical protein